MPQAVKKGRSEVATYAESRGARYVRTHNNSENGPMLAINGKIGFGRQTEWMTFEKKL